MAVMDRNAPPPLGVVRCAAVGLVVFVLAFVSCWAATAFAALDGAHMYISVFTTAPVASTEALVRGTPISAVVGALVGVTGAVSYNLFGFLSPR